MESRNSSSGHRRRMIGVTATSLFVSTLLCGPALADDLPALRQGLWKFQRTVGGKKIETTKCTSPAGFQFDSPPAFQNHSPPCSPACVTG